MQVPHLQRHAYEAPDERHAFAVGGLDPLQGELAAAGGEMHPACLIAAERYGHAQRLGVETDGALPIGDKDPHREQLVVQGDSPYQGMLGILTAPAVSAFNTPQLYRDFPT